MKNIHVNPNYTSAYDSDEFLDSPDLFKEDMDEHKEFIQGTEGSLEWFLQIYGVGCGRVMDHFNFILLCNIGYAGFSAKSSFSVTLRETLRY